MIKKNDVTVDIIVKKIAKNRKLLPEIIKGITSDKPQIKYKSGKVLMIMSEENPEVIYPEWNYFVGLLRSDNTFMKSIGAIIISNLTKVDSRHEFEKIFDEFYGLLDDDSMITAANIVKCSGMIAKAKPKLQSKITDKLLSIDKTRHDPECKNIIKGKAIMSFGEYIAEVEDKERIIKFVKNESRNTRTATKKKAEKFLKKWDKTCF